MIRKLTATVGDTTHEIAVEPLDGGAFRVTVDGRTRIVDARRVEPGTWSLVPAGGGAARLVDVDVAPTGGGDLVVTIGGQTIPMKLGEGSRASLAAVVAPRTSTGPQPVRAPMPGKVVKVLVKKDEPVKAGQGVLVIEAMKMENELRAPRDGVVVEIKAQEGQAVEAGQVLATIA